VRVGNVELVFNPVLFPVLVFLWLLGLLWPGLLFVFSLLLHELAHILMARMLGLTVDAVELLPLGCVVRLVEMLEADPSVEARVAGVGPLVSLGLGGVCFLAYRSFPTGNLEALAWINMAVGTLNLLPALPLDGGRLLRAVLVYRWGFQRGMERAWQISVLAGWLAILGGVLVCLYRPVGLCLISLGAFILLSLRRERRRSGIAFMGYLLARRLGLLCDGKVTTCHLVFTAETSLKEVVANLNHRDYHVIWVVDDRWRLLGMVDEGTLLEAALWWGTGVKIGRLLAELPGEEPGFPKDSSFSQR